MVSEKPHSNLIVIGHAKTGKSTTAGRLMLECGATDYDTIAGLEQVASETGQEKCKYAWVFDRLQAERQRGCSISLTTQQLETSNRGITLTDSPGHREFVKTMISGAAGADCALLVISADDAEHNEGFSMSGQLREHARIAFTLGIHEMIVAVNKMDACGWSEGVFNSIRREVSSYLKKIGYNSDKVPFIPVSSYNGQNISAPKGDLSWYHGTTFTGAIDNIRERLKSWMDLPLRIPIRRVHQIPGVGKVLVGCVVSGTVTPGMSVTVAPTGITATIKTLESHKKRIDKGFPGDLVAFDLGVEADFHRGQVVSDSQNSPATQCSSFIATFQKLVSHSPLKIKSGWSPVVHCHTAQVACKFELLELLDNHGRTIERDPKYIKLCGTAKVRLTPLKPLYVAPFSKLRPFGRFIVRDVGRTIGVGTVQSVEKHE